MKERYEPADGLQPDAPAGPTRDERQTAMACHLATFAGYVFPFGNVVAPLLIWQLKKESSPLIDHHGREAVNFQLSVTLYAVISAVLILVLVGIFLLLALAVFDVVCVVIAAIKANDGLEYRYPFTIRFF